MFETFSLIILVTIDKNILKSKFRISISGTKNYH